MLKLMSCRIFFLVSCVASRRLIHQTKTHAYGLLDSTGIMITLKAISIAYSELTTLSTGQELYGLPTVGNESDCPYDADIVGCKNWILTIEDTSNDISKPAVLLSGAMHGDERIGPTSVLTAVLYILKAAHCESLPRSSDPGKDADEDIWAKWEQELKEARRCRQELEKRGVSSKTRKWLARLASTRKIVVVPTANSVGFYRESRLEGTLDTKLDFPFDLDDKDCMETVTARLMNELHRENLFQIALDFHAGIKSIGYAWGSPSYLYNDPADTVAQDEIAYALSLYSGNEFPYGQLNNEVGPRRGRLEDWAYAASWTKQKQCNPKANGGYDQSKTKYSDSMLRCLSFLVYADEEKNPPKEKLGTSYGLFEHSHRGNGIIPKNVRLTVLAIDIVQPYLVINTVNHVELEDDIVPLSKAAKSDTKSCIQTKTMSIPQGTEYVSIEWEVGGAFSIDDTHLLYALWSDLPNEISCTSQPDQQLLDQLYKEQASSDTIHLSPGGKGVTRWHETSLKNSVPTGTSFTSSVFTKDFHLGDSIAVFAVAQVDSSWNTTTTTTSPQSHLVNARFNPSYFQQLSMNQTIQGRNLWFSIPVTLIIASPNSITEEISKRISYSFDLRKKEQHAIDLIVVSVFLLLFLIIASIFLYEYFYPDTCFKKKIYSRVRPINTVGDSVEMPPLI